MRHLRRFQATSIDIIVGRTHLSSDFRQPVTFDVFYYFFEVKHKSSTVIILLRLFKQGGFAYS